MNEQSKLTQFDYLLNRMENAARTGKPAEHGYGEHRKALFAHVRNLEARAALAAQPVAPAEPVEWQGQETVHFFKGQSKTKWRTLREDELQDWRAKVQELPERWAIRPLYVAPPAAREGWQPMHEAPKDAGPLLLLVPTRWSKRATHIQAQGEQIGPDHWVIFNADEAVQRVEPVGWQRLRAAPPEQP